MYMRVLAPLGPWRDNFLWLQNTVHCHNVVLSLVCPGNEYLLPRSSLSSDPPALGNPHYLILSARLLSHRAFLPPSPSQIGTSSFSFSFFLFTASISHSSHTLLLYSVSLIGAHPSNRLDNLIYSHCLL